MEIFSRLKKKIGGLRPWTPRALWLWTLAWTGYHLNEVCKNIFNVLHASKYLFFQKWVNLHERCGIGCIERKMKFPIFIFRVVVIFVLKTVNFRRIFHNYSKNKNRRIFLLFFPYYITHSPSSIKGWSKVSGGRGRRKGGLHILNCDRAQNWKFQSKVMKKKRLKMIEIATLPKSA